MRHLPALALTLLLPATAQAQSGDVLLDCSACHRGPGQASTSPATRVYPDLNGQPVRYLERQLRAFHEGSRQHAQMQQTARALGDGIGAMARRYADAPHPDLGPAPAGVVPPALVTRGDWSRGLPPCASCHAPDPGSDRSRATPRLHGQPETYLHSQLRAYAEGARQSDPMGRMRDFSARLTPDEMSELAAYYASWAAIRPDASEDGNE